LSQNSIPVADPSPDTPASDAQQQPVGPEDSTGAGQNAQKAVDAINAQADLLRQAFDAFQRGNTFDYNDYMSQAAQQLANYYKYCGCSAPGP
jgi:hypothetical protein